MLRMASLVVVVVSCDHDRDDLRRVLILFVLLLCIFSLVVEAKETRKEAAPTVVLGLRSCLQRLLRWPLSRINGSTQPRIGRRGCLALGRADAAKPAEGAPKCTAAAAKHGCTATKCAAVAEHRRRLHWRPATAPAARGGSGEEPIERKARERGGVPPLRRRQQRCRLLLLLLPTPLRLHSAPAPAARAAARSGACPLRALLPLALGARRLARRKRLGTPHPLRAAAA